MLRCQSKDNLSPREAWRILLDMNVLKCIEIYEGRKNDLGDGGFMQWVQKMLYMNILSYCRVYTLQIYSMCVVEILGKNNKHRVV